MMRTRLGSGRARRGSLLSAKVGNVPAVGSLPPESFVSFAVRRLTDATCVYVNEGVGGGVDWIREFSFVIPSDLTPAATLGAEQRTLLGERYGGFGVGHHGGGVRCGFDGARFQVKGVGRNPLAGRGLMEDDFWHAHGGLALIDAIQEAALAEAIDRALPFGAVRTTAILSTGTRCWYEQTFGKPMKVAAALAVRSANLRPAHFERAVYFRQRQLTPMPTDVTRVRAAIQRLPGFLAQLVGPGCLPETTPRTGEQVTLGLLELAGRFAKQCAVAKSKRLMHGALNGANIGLDGSWLDLGTATLLPDYANRRPPCAPHHALPFWEEHKRLFAVLSNLTFYVSKYYFRQDPFTSQMVSSVTKEFCARYDDELSKAFTRLAGFPETLLSPHWQGAEAKQFGVLCIKAARRCTEQRATRAEDGTPANAALGTFLSLLTRWCADESCDSRLQRWLPDRKLRVDIIRAYDSLASRLRQEASRRGISTRGLQRLCSIGIARAAKNIRMLDRDSMKRHCRTLIEQPAPYLEQSVRAFIDRLRDEASSVYDGERDLVCPLWTSGDVKLRFDGARDRWTIETRRGTEVVDRLLSAGSVSLAPVREYWGEALWEEVVAE